MTRGKAAVGAAAASFVLIALAKAAFEREIPSSHAQDVSRAWFSAAVLAACFVALLVANARSNSRR